MSMIAIIPVAQMQAANAALEEAGFGPHNFSVACYGATGATHGALHAWNDAAFFTAIKALPGVACEESDGNPVTRTQALIAAHPAVWGEQSPLLPSAGMVAVGLYHDDDGALWNVIQAFNRTTYGGDPAQYPALIRRQRKPGEVIEWRQPLDQYDAYNAVNAFTGQPDECTHAGKQWRTDIANNVWEPGTLNSHWLEIDPQTGEPIPPPPANAEWAPGVAYKVGDLVTYQGQTYRCLQAHTSQAGWTPVTVPALWQLQP